MDFCGPDSRGLSRSWTLASRRALAGVWGGVIMDVLGPNQTVSLQVGNNFIHGVSGGNASECPLSIADVALKASTPAPLPLASSFIFCLYLKPKVVSG